MNQTVKPRDAEILLVDDNPADVRLVREAIYESRLRNALHVVGDGEEALAFLRRESGFADAPRPDLVLLDLNLPKKNGREVLAEMKCDEALKDIPVVILTTSNSDRDVLESYNLCANCYVRKPVQFQAFIDVVQSIENFWFKIVTLPQGTSA
jgi:two-component system, chemotaxis family, response regulator Rcp1